MTENVLASERMQESDTSNLVTHTNGMTGHLHKDAEASSSIDALYQLECQKRGIEPFRKYITILKGVPGSLFVDIVLDSPPKGRAGGAAINAGIEGLGLQERDNTELMPTIDQVIALVDILTAKPAIISGKVLILDHLDLSGISLPITILQTLVDQARLLGPWWRLRSLSLSKCNLSLEHLHLLTSDSSIPLVMRLERLDISWNPNIGREDDGCCYSAINFMRKANFFCANLWRNAPLKFLNLAGTELKSNILLPLLRIMKNYELPSISSCFGMIVHDGTRPNLESLHLGPLPDRVWESDLIKEICDLKQSFISFKSLKIYGEIEVSISETIKSSLFRDAETENGIQNSAAEEADFNGVSFIRVSNVSQHLLSIEQPPSSHTHPVEDPIVEDTNKNSDIDISKYHILDDWSRDLIGKPKNFNSTRSALTGEHEFRTVISRVDHKFSDTRNHKRKSNAAGQGISPFNGEKGKSRVQKPKRDGVRRVGTKGCSSRSTLRMYRGGLAEDELRVHDIDLSFEGNMLDPSDSETEQSSNDSSLGRPSDGSPWSPDINKASDLKKSGQEYHANQHQRCDIHRVLQRNNCDEKIFAKEEKRTHHEKTSHVSRKHFKLRDGELDEDSRLGKVYKKVAKKLAESIADKMDRRKALIALKNWDTIAINAWDQHRWENPSKDQDDAPHVLGQLNLLYDLLHKHKLLQELRFPFPKWIPGGGSMAFDKKTYNSETKRIESGHSGEKENPRNLGNIYGNEVGNREISESDLDEDLQHVSISTKTRRYGQIISDESEDDESNPGSIESEQLPSSETNIDNDGKSLCDFESPSIIDKNINHQNPVSGDEKPDAQRYEASSLEPVTSKENCIHPKGTLRQNRELQRLSAWSWDSRINDYPANQDFYAAAQSGPRSRRQYLTSSQMLDFLSEKEVALCQSNELCDITNGDVDKKGESKKTFNCDSDGGDSDDDLPLGVFVNISSWTERPRVGKGKTLPNLRREMNLLNPTLPALGHATSSNLKPHFLDKNITSQPSKMDSSPNQEQVIPDSEDES